MVKIVRLPEIPSDEQLAALRGFDLFHSDILDGSHSALRLAGLNPMAVPAEGVPDGGILILPENQPSGPLEDVVRLMDRLLGPGGCPWDQVQTHETLKTCLLEETYEVLEAIDKCDDRLLEEELGDLLLQPIMHAQIAAKSGRFDSRSVAKRLVEKLVYRHPHVFGDVQASDPETVLANWQKLKQLEKGEERKSVLAGIPQAAPALQRALNVSKRAASCGFEWPSIEAVWEKVREEEKELSEAIAVGNQGQIEAELGDLLFTLVNVARWLKVDPEDALRTMVDRFVGRFQAMESASPKPLAELDPQEWDDLWNQAKRSTSEPTSAGQP